MRPNDDRFRGPGRPDDNATTPTPNACHAKLGARGVCFRVLPRLRVLN
jgi:hypothetical protein